MKKVTTILMLAIGFLFVQGTPVEEKEPTGIQFFDGTWAEAVEAAKAENKLIFLDAYASWCGPCKLLKRRVFTDPDVGEFFNDNFINVAMDMEKGEGRRLANELKVTAYPTLFFINAEGQVIKKAVGYHTSEQLLGVAKPMGQVGA